MSDHWQLSRAQPLADKDLGLIVLSLHLGLSQSSYCLYRCSTQVLQSRSSRSCSLTSCINTEQTGCSLPQGVYSPQPVTTSCNCSCVKPGRIISWAWSLLPSSYWPSLLSRSPMLCFEYVWSSHDFEIEMIPLKFSAKLQRKPWCSYWSRPTSTSMCRKQQTKWTSQPRGQYQHNQHLPLSFIIHHKILWDGKRTGHFHIISASIASPKALLSPLLLAALLTGWHSTYVIRHAWILTNPLHLNGRGCQAPGREKGE